MAGDIPEFTDSNFESDVMRSVALVEEVIEVAEQLVMPNGAFVAKIFEGRGIDRCVLQLKSIFKRVERFRPKSTRSQSREIFLVGLKRKDLPA